MIKKILLTASLFISIATISVAQSPTVGGDSDKHGCKGSAGYTYSKLKKECVQAFMQDVKLNGNESAGTADYMAAVIFSSNKKQAEVIMKDESVILKRTGKVDNYVWKSGGYQLSEKGGYTLTKAKNIVYSAK